MKYLLKNFIPHTSKIAEEWMGRLITEATECEYKDNDSRLKEQFINDINDEVMTAEIVNELSTIKYTSETTSGVLLLWVKAIENQRLQMAMLESLSNNKEHDTICKIRYRARSENHKPKQIGD